MKEPQKQDRIDSTELCAWNRHTTQCRQKEKFLCCSFIVVWAFIYENKCCLCKPDYALHVTAISYIIVTLISMCMVFRDTYIPFITLCVGIVGLEESCGGESVNTCWMLGLGNTIKYHYIYTLILMRQQYIMDGCYFNPVRFLISDVFFFWLEWVTETIRTGRTPHRFTRRRQHLS